MDYIINHNKRIEMKEIKNSQEFQEGQKLEYIGKGFIGWDPNQPIMTFAMKDLINPDKDIWVDYNGYRIMVSKTDVK